MNTAREMQTCTVCKRALYYCSHNAPLVKPTSVPAPTKPWQPMTHRAGYVYQYGPAEWSGRMV